MPKAQEKLEFQVRISAPSGDPAQAGESAKANKLAVEHGSPHRGYWKMTVELFNAFLGYATLFNAKFGKNSRGTGPDGGLGGQGGTKGG